MLTTHPILNNFTLDNSKFIIEQNHMISSIPCPIKADVLSSYELEAFDILISDAIFEQQYFDLWVGYSGSKIFNSESDVRYRYSTYLSYLKTSPEEVQNIAKCIVHELKTYPEKYDLTSIVMALAQNGGICAVQKEVGLRMVYASMTDSILQHINAESIETKVLLLLKNLRETLTERAAEKILRQLSYEMNTHYIMTIRNKLAESIGLTPIKDPNAYTIPEKDCLTVFMDLYTIDEIVKCLKVALNDSPRKMDYLDVLNFLVKHKPEDVDEYQFKEEFLFDVSSGHFTDAAIRFMLIKMNIIKIP